ncbi:MAG: acyltransferase family protein [Eggerthellaceae bacterium]
MSGTKSRYIPALDGLRAFAVLAVIAYHLGMQWAPGGLLGVTVFFVLSGYLITSLLLIEWDNTETINLPQFWLRRVRRLMPAIVLVIVCTAALCALLDHSLLTKLRDDMWAALLWVTNWWYIFQDASYFDALGAPRRSPTSGRSPSKSSSTSSGRSCCWSPTNGREAHHLRNATLIVALLSALEMALLYNPLDDPSRCTTAPTPARSRCLSAHGWRSCGPRTCWEPRRACTLRSRCATS